MEEEKKNIHSAASAHRAQDVVDKSQFTKYHTGKDGRTGHSFAAEDVNDLADRHRLKNTEKVGISDAASKSVIGEQAGQKNPYENTYVMNYSSVNMENIKKAAAVLECIVIV